ncbi:MAG: hypothetical protein GF344_10500, partial [Chitinivibrionales bacterium]|nr:hypothetical protein [Chitinivibrionales bacterium]MBD3357255.1 hypothetical protein [Chitinivibrionales bacterium]
MKLKYKRYEFTRPLGWSSSRYETFDKCKRQYYYTYYRHHIRDVPSYRIEKLRSLTSVPLEMGNVVHDVLEAFLWRLQKSDSDIDEQRFYDYAKAKTDEYFSRKTFLEIYYGQRESLDMTFVHERIGACLKNFIGSPIYHWLYMKAMNNRDNWMIEPPGYGETRLDGLKAYCKMDFLFPVDGHIYIIDWKTGKKDLTKHRRQLIGYATAASSNFDIPIDTIFPRIVYLQPSFEELELSLHKDSVEQ